jgi:DNA-binding CsgD family transcriptional regulator
MTRSVQPLLQLIHQTPDVLNLRSLVAPQIGEYFAATRSGIFFWDQPPFLNRSLSKTMQMGLSVDRNPVVRYIVERHAPVHEAMVTSPKVWQMICPRPDHWHVMAGPIVSGGQLIGAVGCTRDRTMRAFNPQNLTDLSAICLHLSAWAAALRLQQAINFSPIADPNHDRKGKNGCLTPRELQIAELVAQGHTNSEIGRELWITENSVKQALKRMFRKLDVSSRAEMVAQLWVGQF